MRLIVKIIKIISYEGIPTHNVCICFFWLIRARKYVALIPEILFCDPLGLDQIKHLKKNKQETEKRIFKRPDLLNIDLGNC
jgi:hypothetical protein